MSKNQAGKGDKPRPVNKQVFNDNFDKISWKENKFTPKEIKNKKGKVSYKY
jgi:hypothetical protein